MNATVLNGAVIGAGSLVAAGRVVLEGTQIPPRSLVAGVPGKVRRPLTDEEYAKIVRNAEHYLDLAAQHRTHDWAGLAAICVRWWRTTLIRHANPQLRRLPSSRSTSTTSTTRLGFSRGGR